MFAALVAVLAVGPVAAAPNPSIEFAIEGRGRLLVELRPDKAPLHVAHVLRLVQDEWYDGTLVHRKVPGFVVQGGDPYSKGMTPEEARSKPGERGGTLGLGDGGSGFPVKFERNDLKHEVGTMGMASEGPGTDTGDSQWFINLARNERLDGKYVAFGQVVEGMKVLKSMERGDRILWARVVRERR